ncbi:YdcF family protein [Limoniibacter endophyticus]|uniref:DUF218 domain-containing protein n=1 Tax=Limoniibacter endophyticus TaxID=1565040 RepID=A0A8J3DJQ6_9HYPH|nr:YdcF family protein [Limoniibacter endophyticus]GHC62227.1 hypothetical protein GCM10010136_03260 [Limoniibacter endophyticus]
MFFIVSKIVGFFLHPINLTILFLALGFALRFTRFVKISTSFAAGGILILILAAWSSLGSMLLIPLEDHFPRPEAASIGRIAGIIVLGGGMEGAINLTRGTHDLNSAGDRFVETAILARQFPDVPIIISGGNGELVLEGEGDADTALRLLTLLGVDRERLVPENKSRNTHENAVFSKAVARPQPGQKWLLITSAFHMPRSVALFRQVGFDVIAWPVDYRTSGAEGVGFFRDNTNDNIAKLNLGIREWIGLVVYRFSGRTSDLLPAP